MAITYVGSSFSASATPTTPAAAQEGDLCIAYAGNGNSTTVPSLPAGWNDVGTRSGNLTAMRTAWAWYTEGMDETPTFTNATGVLIVALRGADLNDPIGAYNNNNASSATITFPALTPFDVTNGTSWFTAAVVGNRPDVVIPAPSGTTLRQQNGTRPGYLLVDTNGGVTTWAQHTVSVSRAAGYTLCQTEIKAKTTVTVGITRALPYKVVGNVQVQRDLPYKVRLFVQVQRDLLYELTQTISVARALPSAIRKFVEVARTLPYALTETPTNEIVGVTRNLPWQMSGLVGIQRRVPYKVRAFVAVARTLLNKIRNLVGISRTLKWTDRVLSTVSRTLPWKTRVFVSVSRTVMWTDKIYASIARRVPTRVLGLAGVVRRVVYGILGLLENEQLLKARVRVDTDPQQVEVGTLPDQVHVASAPPQVSVEAESPVVGVVQPAALQVRVGSSHPVVKTESAGYAVRVASENPVVEIKENT